MIYNMYIFDRHCQCIYYHDWHRGHTAKNAFDQHGDPLASHASASGGGGGSTTTTTTMTDPRQGMNMSLEEEGKLVYGVVYSLRNLVKKLGKGQQDGFIAYRTSHYKLHYYETLTGLKFVLNSDPGVESLQQALRQIYTQLYVELVIKNPLANAGSNGASVNPETMGAEGFRNGVDRFVRSLTMFDTL
ncbi:Sybindin-like protein [Lobosporangium transversale]|uniref:Trafficking protein particle complex subunit n=1 Tax=Lobosporangium transversale TaxID=64571 RepID=A0A1Y2GPS1_9FUNG|nr:Sybindin-like protein [Lobosporangium transversale]ORZ18282.1 Sybindin-like protein [Lobosporangium transversale]|eukprot:XP_021882077.1 Sybindin-like protein [Lobosporangium transversale]